MRNSEYIEMPSDMLFLNIFLELICLFVRQSVWGFSSQSKTFHSLGEVHLTGERLQILTYARHSWPLSSEGFSVCHTYCDAGHTFILVISNNTCHSHLLPSVLKWSCHYLFERLTPVTTGIRTPYIPLSGQTV